MPNPTPARLLRSLLLLVLAAGPLGAKTALDRDDSDIDCAVRPSRGEREAWSKRCSRHEKDAAPGGSSSAERQAQEISGSAKGLNQALRSESFSSLYDGSEGRGRASLAVSAPPLGRADLAVKPSPERAAPRASRPEPAADSDEAPLSEKEADQLFHYEPPRSWVSKIPLIGSFLDDYIVRPIRKLFSGSEKRYFREMTSKLQESPEGRRITRGLYEEYRDSGQRVEVRLERGGPYAGSVATQHDGVEDIDGLQGYSNPEPDDGDGPVFSASALFMDMKDGLPLASATMGHELTHLLLRARVKRGLKRFQEVFDLALVNEQSARLKGLLVAMELNDGKANAYTMTAQRIVDQKPQAYWNDMKYWSSGYAVCLQQRELLDPASAYRKRIIALERRIGATEEDNREHLPLLLRQLEHMLAPRHADWLKARGLGERVARFGEQMKAYQRFLPGELDDLREARRAVEEKLNFVTSPKGADLVALMAEAARDKGFAAMIQSVLDDEKKLVALVVAKKIASPPDAGPPMDRVLFRALFLELHREVPRADPPWAEADAG